jgi:hypothetical protein
VPLDADEIRELRRRFPRVFVQVAVSIETSQGREKLALVWQRRPTIEKGCPKGPREWNAYVEQSCTGFAGNFAGPALIARFTQAKVVQYLPLSDFFSHDANPSGAGERQRRSAFVPTDFAFEFLDVNGDGYRNEFLYHVGNGPYAMMSHWVAIGVVDDRLEALKDPTKAASQQNCATGALVATPEAWASLAVTGRGQYELYCGARCADTAQRWVLERTEDHHLHEKTFWSCSPSEESSWKEGEPPNVDVCHARR